MGCALVIAVDNGHLFTIHLHAVACEGEDDQEFLVWTGLDFFYDFSPEFVNFVRCGVNQASDVSEGEF